MTENVTAESENAQSELTARQKIKIAAAATVVVGAAVAFFARKRVLELDATTAPETAQSDN